MKENISTDWKFKELFIDLDKIYINGLSLWDYEWHETSEYVTVVDPSNKNQTYHKQICYIENDDDKYYFIAFEFSMNCWGIYIKDDYEIKIERYGKSIFEIFEKSSKLFFGKLFKKKVRYFYNKKIKL